jgi:Tfp pilus assembly protein PilO
MKREIFKNNPFLAKLREKLYSGDKRIFAVILALLIAIICLDFALIMKPQARAIKNLGPKIIKLKTDLDSLDKGLARMKELQAKQEKPQRDAAASKRFISQQEIPYIMEVISLAASKNGVSIIQMKPSQEKRAPADKFTPVGITMDLICDYHRLGKFINDLENGEVFFTLQSMRISVQAQDMLNQRVSLALKTYVKK